MFSFEEFYTHESYSDKIEYAKKHLEFLGSGSSRHVFAIDDKTVLKVASNENGIIQNNVEKFYCDSEWERLTRVFDYDEDFMWLLAERTAPIDIHLFENTFGISIDKLYVHLYHQRAGIFSEDIDTKADIPISENTRDLLEMKKKTKDVAIVKEILQKSVEMGFNNADIPIIENWGLRKTPNGDYLVITDCGNFDKRFRKFPLKNQDLTSPL